MGSEREDAVSTREPSPASDPVEVLARREFKRAVGVHGEWGDGTGLIADAWYKMADSDLRAVVEQTDYRLVRRCYECGGDGAGAWSAARCPTCAGRGWSEQWGDET